MELIQTHRLAQPIHRLPGNLKRAVVMELNVPLLNAIAILVPQNEFLCSTFQRMMNGEC